MISTRATDRAGLVLRAENLGLKINGRWLFRALNLELQPGTFLAVVGPSGVGKTSLLRCLAGMQSPLEGRVCYATVSGANLTLPQVRNDIGIIFQNLRLIRSSNALTNVCCGRLGRQSFWHSCLGFRRKQKEDAFQLLSDFGVGEIAFKWVSETSGGEQQRVAVARALYQDPEIYLADEPVANLDNYYAGRILGRFREEVDRNQKSVLCIMHDPRLVERFADLVLGLNPKDGARWTLRKVRR